MSHIKLLLIEKIYNYPIKFILFFEVDTLNLRGTHETIFNRDKYTILTHFQNTCDLKFERSVNEAKLTPKPVFKCHVALPI